jgi:hypothetical protein
MKLRKIYESILNEIGDSVQVPSGAKFKMTEYEGKVEFDLFVDQYSVTIRIVIKQSNQVALAIDFIANNDINASMTNKGNAIKVMSNVVGCIDEWLKRYKKHFFNNDPLLLNYLKFNPKSESDEKFDEGGNKRDRLYRMFIEKFAKKYNSNVTFSTVGGVTAIFRPMLEIK